MRVSPYETPHLCCKVVVSLDGVDVTDRCRMADDGTGEVVVLCEDERHRDWRVRNKRTHVTPDAGELGPCELRAKGTVQIDVLA